MSNKKNENCFTDDDLKRLKEWLEYARTKYNGRKFSSFMREIYAPEMEALLVRLEAAEACARTGMNYRLKREEGSRDWKEHLEYFDSNWSKWRSSAGQDPKVYQRDKWRKAVGK